MIIGIIIILTIITLLIFTSSRRWNRGYCRCGGKWLKVGTDLDGFVKFVCSRCHKILWRGSSGGGINLMGLVVGILIISIAAIATTKIFSAGWGFQVREMERIEALHLAKSYVEKTQLKLHTITPDEFKRDRGIHGGESYIDGEFTTFVSPISSVDLVETGNGVDYYTFVVRTEKENIVKVKLNAAIHRQW